MPKKDEKNFWQAFSPKAKNKRTDEIMDFNVNQFAEIHVIPALEKLPQIIKQIYLFYFSIELFAVGLLIGA